MIKDKRFDRLVLVIRWVARIIGIGFVGLFILFLIGEGGIDCV